MHDSRCRHQNKGADQAAADQIGHDADKTAGMGIADGRWMIQ
jgi:hypothetical protein